MPHLEKAKLQPVRADRNNSPAGDAVDVQFNPTSLRLRLSNQTEGGRSRGRQRRQHTGTSSTVLTMQLVFDTADETTGSADAPQAVSVRTRTAMVEQFVLPREDGSETPPLVKFSWNELVIIGIVENVDIDFDLFAADGVPLRAKVSLSIKEQDPRYQYLQTGAGARGNRDAQAPGANSAGQPGSGNPAAGNRSAPALAGESGPEFAARMGLDPSAWRGLDVDLSAGLSLEAGLEVGFSAGLSLDAGVGFSAGFSAGADASLEASFGLAAGTGAGPGTNLSAGSSAGFALSAAGGVSAAIESVKSIQAQTASQAAKKAFTPPGQTPPAPSSVLSGVVATSAKKVSRSRPAAATAAEPAAAHEVASLKSPRRRPTEHTPLTSGGFSTYSEQQQAPATASVPNADKRTTGFGRGVPLRDRIRTTQTRVQPRICTLGAPVSESSCPMPEFSTDPTVSPWIKLPARDKGRRSADRAEEERKTHPCSVLYTKREKPV